MDRDSVFRRFTVSPASGAAAFIESEVGQGTSIKVFLPRASTHSAARCSSAYRVEPASAPFRILLVEDDDEVAEPTTELLRDIGLQVLRVSDGKSALATFERDPTIEMVLVEKPYHPDVVAASIRKAAECADRARSQTPS